MRFLSWIFLNIITCLIALCIIFSVFATRIGQEKVYSNTFSQFQLTSKIVDLLQGSELTDIPNEKVLTYLHFNIIAQKLGNRETVDNLIKTNNKLLIEYLQDNRDDWLVAVPLDKINTEINANLNEKIVEYVAKNQRNLTVCSPKEEKSINTDGFKNGQDFCIPLIVRNGEVTWLRFIDDKTGNYLGAIYQKGVFENSDGSIDTLKISQFTKITRIAKQLKQFKFFWSSYYLVVFLLLFVMIIIFYLVNLNSGISLVFLLRNLAILIGLYGIGIMTVIILLLIKTDYLSSIVRTSISPDFATMALIETFSTVIFQLILEILLPLYWYFFTFLTVGLLALILIKIRLFETTSTKNNKLDRKQIYGGQTLDSDFQTTLKKENMLRSFGSSNLLDTHKSKSVVDKLNNIKVQKDDKVIASFQNFETLNTKLSVPKPQVKPRNIPGL